MNLHGSKEENLPTGPPDEGGDGAPDFDFVLPIPDDDDDFPVGVAGMPPAPADNEQVGGIPGLTPIGSPKGEPNPVGGRPTATGRRRGSQRKRGNGTFLGVYVTPTNVFGALLQDDGSGIRVVRRFLRQRNAHGDEAQNFAGLTADTAESDDVSVQFTKGGEFNSGGDLFLGSEFGDLASLGEFDESQAGMKEQASPIVFELKDLLDECATAGFDKPQTAFCIGQPAVEYVELLVPDEKARKSDKKKEEKASAEEDASKRPHIKRDRLLARLAEEYEEPFDKERVDFVPMTPREGVQRFLAVVPTTEDALPESLDLLRELSGMRSVPLRSIDAEVPLLMGLTRWAYSPGEQENTAIVRVGTENTLVILLQGNELHHQEHMHSVTTFDGPDTICSRVLLQQDVQGIGTVHQVIVLSEEREDELVRGFSAFYPDARVAALRRGIREHGITPPNGENALAARSLPAVGVALRLALQRQKVETFENVNLLPKRLRRTRPKLDLAVAWHTILATVLLFFSVLFFVGLFFAQQRQIAAAELRVASYPEQVAMSPQALQAQIDSLQSVYARVTMTLGTIDSLLVGSDRWSRSMAQLARSTASTGGTWVEQWNPQGHSVQLTGQSTGRNQVVQFAERMNGSINELRFSEIRDYPVYTFVLTAPIPNELPEVANYLRQQAEVSFGREQDPLGGVLIDEEPATPARPNS